MGEQELPKKRQILPDQELRKQRQLRGWSQEDLAEKLGISVKTVSRWEQGEVFPTLRFRQKLSEILNMSPQELGFIQEEDEEEKKRFSDPDTTNYPPLSSVNSIILEDFPDLENLFPRKDIYESTERNYREAIRAINENQDEQQALLTKQNNKSQILVIIGLGLLWLLSIITIFYIEQLNPPVILLVQLANIGLVICMYSYFILWSKSPRNQKTH